MPKEICHAAEAGRLDNTNPEHTARRRKVSFETFEKAARSLVILNTLSGTFACRKSLLGAEQNYYVQLYVEDTGKPGDIRISEVGKSGLGCRITARCSLSVRDFVLRICL